METNEIYDWIYLANADIDSALLLKQMRPQHKEIIAYHCQQAVEKYLKVFLILSKIEPPKTHDLRVLCQLCKDVNVSFCDLETICGLLTPFGIQPRYPHEMDITERTIENVISYVQTIQNFEPIKQLIEIYSSPEKGAN